MPKTASKRIRKKSVGNRIIAGFKELNGKLERGEPLDIETFEWPHVITGDCVKWLSSLPKGCANLVIADPPYNMGRDYENYDDSKPIADYLEWARSWMAGIKHVLHEHGSFWLFIGDRLVSELDVMAKNEFGFYKRSHVVWCYTFGVNCAKNFTKAHTHILYYTAHKSKHTFNAEDPGLRVPSARQLIYGDKRANPRGRLPDDIWVLRQKELEQCFNGDADVWLQSRICGTFRERVKGADNQLPLAILDRIIRATSHHGDLVIDPFLGTGSSAESAMNLGRRCLGIEIGVETAELARQRIEKAKRDTGKSK